MRPRLRFLLPFATALAIVLMLAIAGQSQSTFRISPPAWEYATLVGNNTGFYAQLCYTNVANGCSFEQVAGGLTRGSAYLGEQGWELTATEIDPVSSYYTLFFKRPKAAR